MTADLKIEVHGLREFRTNLRRMDRNLPKGLRTAGNKAAEVVVKHAKPKVPRRTGKAAGSVRAASTQSAARVAGGGARVPYYPWLDFGGAVGRNNSVKRPFYKTGRYIWKSFAEHKGQVQDELHDALVEVAEGAGVRVSG